jgi:hypothetical protein
MRITLGIIGLVLFVAALSACGLDVSTVAPNEVEGPALLMFYSDG